MLGRGCIKILGKGGHKSERRVKIFSLVKKMFLENHN